MGQKIDRDHQRFRKIVRGKVKSNLREVHQPRRDDRQEGQRPRQHPAAADRHAAVPLRPEGLRRRRPGRRASPASRSTAPQGERRAAGRRPAGRAHPRSRADAWRSWPRSSARSWPCRASSRAARRTSSPRKDKYTSIRQAGPESLRHFKRTFKRALKRQIASGTYNPDDPIVIPIREDKQYRSWKEVPKPETRRRASST